MLLSRDSDYQLHTVNYAAAAHISSYNTAPTPNLVLDALLKVFYVKGLVMKQLPRVPSKPSLSPSSLSSLISSVWSPPLPAQIDVDKGAPVPISCNAVITILHNLSYVASNQRFLAYHLGTVYLLTAIAFKSRDFGDGAKTLAFTTLVNIAPYLDVVGKTFYEEIYITPPHASVKEAYSLQGVARSYAARFFENGTVPPYILLPVSSSHIQFVASLFASTIESIMSPSTKRKSLVESLQLFDTLCEVDDNKEVLDSIPASFAMRLTKFLFVLKPSSQLHVDVELRDNAVSVLYSLIKSSPKNRDIVKSTIGCVSELTLIRDTDNNTTTKNQETIYKATTSLQMLDKSRIK